MFPYFTRRMMESNFTRERNSMREVKLWIEYDEMTERVDVHMRLPGSSEAMHVQSAPVSEIGGKRAAGEMALETAIMQLLDKMGWE